MLTGRPKGSTSGRKLGIALAEASTVANRAATMRATVDCLSPRQMRLFTALLQSNDELEALIRAEEYCYITGVAKVVYDRTGKKVRTSSIKQVEDLARLSPDSYARLLRLAKSAVNHNVGSQGYVGYLKDISWYFKLCAPEAFAVVMSLIRDEHIPPATRLKAALEVLDRAGYADPLEPELQETMPIQLVMHMRSVGGTEEASSL